MAVRPPSDKRFRRAHLSPARKRWRRPVLAAAALMCGVAVYAGYRAWSFALTTEALTISRITVSGNARLSRGEVLALVGGLQGTSLITADLDRWRRVLLDSPWVADAILRRVLPGTVSVAIAERQPIGIGRLADTLYLIDEGGVIIDEFGPNYAEFDLPLIDGLATPRAGATLVDPARAAVVGRLLLDLRHRPDIARRVSQIDVTDPSNASVILKGETTLLRLGHDQFAARLQSYLDLASALRERVPDIDYVDLRFGERVYLKPNAARIGAGAGNN